MLPDRNLKSEIWKLQNKDQIPKKQKNKKQKNLFDIEEIHVAPNDW